MERLTRRELFRVAGAIGAGAAFGSLDRTDSEAATTEPVPLRNLADKLGLNLTIFYELQWNFPRPPKLWEIAAREFNAGTFYFGMNQLQKVEGNIDLSLTRELIQFGNSQGMKMFGQPLIWGRKGGGTPEWLTEPRRSRAEMLAVMTHWIETVMGELRGQVYAWAVVSEYGFDHDVFLETIGPDYLEIAYSIARAADPSAILICIGGGWNHVSNNPDAQLTKELVERLRPLGLIDGVGLEIKAKEFVLDEADLIATMRSYNLPVFVTEFAVNLTKVPGTQDERLAFQAAQYRTVLSAAIKSGVCHDFTVWGVVDKFSPFEMQPKLGGYGSNADACPYDDDFQPKPAYYTMQSVLQAAVDEKFKFRRSVPLLSTDG